MELAQSVAHAAGADLLRLPCYQGINEEKAIGQFAKSMQELFVLLKTKAEVVYDWDQIRRDVTSRAFFLAGPLLTAIEQEKRCVLLIDEIDKVDYAFDLSRTRHSVNCCRSGDFLDNVMIRTDGSYVAGFRIAGTLTYFSDDEGRDETKELVESLLRTVPEQSMRLQFRYEVVEGLHGLLIRYEDYRRTQNFEALVLESHRVQQWKDCIDRIGVVRLAESALASEIASWGYSQAVEQDAQRFQQTVR